MGGEFGDEDERLITRLENNQYDPATTGPTNGLEDGGDDSSLPPHGLPGSGNQPGDRERERERERGLNAPGPPVPWSTGPPPSSTPGSGPPSVDNRTGNSSTGSNGPQGRQEDKKHSPISQ